MRINGGQVKIRRERRAAVEGAEHGVIIGVKMTDNEEVFLLEIA
jgi:hypothetical protein